MSTTFQITTGTGKSERNYEAVLIRYGYGFRVEVNVECSVFVFEPDEEKNLRVVAMEGTVGLKDNRVLQEIAGALALLLEGRGA